jgi:PAS domain S-box-containing protein
MSSPGREQLREPVTQRAAVSALGSLALEGRPIAELLDEAAWALYETLASDLIVVLERTADGGPSICACSGKDFAISAVPSRELRRALALLCGTGETLLSSHLPSETRFRAPALEAYGILSLVSVPTGSGATAFGALVACSWRRGAFNEADVAFVSSIAHVLTAAIERERAVVAAAVADSATSAFWELSHDLLAVFSSDGRFLQASSSWRRVLGWAPEELIGRPALELVVPEDRPATSAGADVAMLGGSTVSEVVNRFRAKDGSSRRLLWNVRQDPDGSVHAVAKDITECYEQQSLAIRHTEQLNDAQRLAQMGSWETDFSSGLHTLSESLREMLVCDSSSITDEGFLSRVHPEDRDRMRTVMATHPGEDQSGEFRVLLRDDRIRAFSSLVRPVCDAAGNLTGLRGTVKDVTETRRAEVDLRRSEERFRQGFDNAPIAMVLVDPANFAFLRVNASFCSMVGRTREALDEMKLADVSHPDDLAHDRESVRRLLTGELDHYIIDKRYVRPDDSEVWASVSITPVRDPHDGDIDVLFGQMLDITERKRHEASLRAKLEDVAALGDIRRAFEEDRFELHAQPIIDLATGETVQRELLIRMREPGGALVPPAAFLPAAEKYGAIRDIDRWVISQAADLAARGIDVEINISAASIGDAGLIADIEHELARTGADPSRLVFEITETALIAETKVAVKLAERLRQLGCRFALDDFGSGYGGFHYLKYLPMDFLKIDREFIRDARTNVADQHVIHAVVGLARGFGLKTIAEGVEDQETVDLLRASGVDHAQGFHLGRPAPLAVEEPRSPRPGR